MLPGFPTGGAIVALAGGAATVPAQFQTGHWSVADAGTGGGITIKITAIPSNGGSAITDLQYQIDVGSWVSLGATSTGSYPISGLTDDVEVGVAIRAVNAIGNGTASATKAVTPTALLAIVTEYLEAEELTHDWANLTGWTSAGVSVSSNRLYGSSSNPTAALKAFSVGPGEHAKVVAEIVRVSGNNGAQYIGFDFNGGVAASLPGFVGCGLRASTFYDTYVGANFTGVTVGATQLQASGTGTFFAILTIDDVSISMVIRNSAGSVEARRVIPRSSAPNGGVVTGIMVWNGDNRVGTGSYIKAIGAKKSFTPFRTKTNAAGTIEGNVGVVHYRSDADRWRIHFPAVMDGTAPTPVCIFFHQASSGDEGTPVAEARALNVDQALDAGGYIVLSAYDQGDRWGNQASLNNYAAMLAWVRARHYCGPVVLLGVSGGAMTAWNAILRGDIDAAAIAGVCPVTDLDNMEANSSFRASVRAAYGAADNAQYITNSAGYDPNDETDFSAFTGKGVKFYVAASGDTTVPNATHVNVFQPKISPFAAEATVISAGTGHLANEQYQGSDLVTFFNTYV